MVRRLFRRKKKGKIKEQGQTVKKTKLEEICGNDKDACKALLHTMFYDPTKIKTTMGEAARKAASFEKSGDSNLARVWYHIAGGLALWKGDVSKVKQYFGKCEKLAPDMGYGMITKIPDKAVEKAQKFYGKFLKPS